MKKLYLLINLGTPSSPAPTDVSRFLKEFLNDPLVINGPTWFRRLLVHGWIVPRRAQKASQAYKSIWTHRGSPLRVHLDDLVQSLRQQMPDDEVRGAMRYGSPSIQEALQNIDPQVEVKILPLYPQYALSSTQSSLNEVTSVTRRLGLKNKIQFLPYFYQYDEFTLTYARHFQQKAPPQWDHILFSFHGLPVNHLTQVAPSSSPCSKENTCCENISTQNLLCYRAQSFHTAHAIARHLSLSPSQYSISFQSRLGRLPWIQPYTDTWIEEAATRGLKNLVVLCPSFVSDCLETLEEIQQRECKNFKKQGGHSLTLIPGLNSERIWSQALHSLLTQHDKDWLPLADPLWKRVR